MIGFVGGGMRLRVYQFVFDWIKWPAMRLNKIDNFDKRAASSASAKAALLDKFRTRPDLNDPEFQERQKARADAAAAKIAREVERKAAKEAEIARWKLNGRQPMPKRSVWRSKPKSRLGFPP